MKTSGGLICEGIIDGNNGVNGYNTIAIALYRRSANTLTNSDRPTGTLTYSFDTGRLTGVSSYFNGWSQNIPATQAGTKLYVIMAVARSQSNTDDIAASDWSTPTEYVADGMNSAVVFIYKRAESVNDKPANGAVYNFKTGVLSGTLNDWSTSIPATDSNHNPCWVRQAMAVSSADTDTIDSSEWSDPATKIVEDGAKGGNTAPIYLYKRSATAVTSVGTLPTLYYSFSKKRLYTNAECTTLFNGSNDWYQDIPSGTNQIYVTTAIAFSAEDSDSIGGSEWVKPVQFTENGEHGVNTATIFIYKRSASQPTDKPTGNIRYTFANGSKALQSGVMNDWSFEIPSGTDACWVRQAAALGTGTYDDVEPSEWSDPATKLVENGTSAWVADGDNEMDSIATDLNGVVTSSKTITDNIKLFHGATEENFTFMSIKRNGTVLTWDANNNNVWPRCSGKTLQIEYDTNAAFAGDKDEYEVTICSAADISIDRVVRIVVNGIRPGATGESATLYNLVPSVTEIVKKKNGTYSPTRFSCACTSLKNNTATDNPSEATMEYSYDETKWYEFTSTSSFLSENVYNNGGRFYIRLLVGGKVMDKETIPVVADGDKGDNAVEYAIVFSEAWAKCDSNNHVTGVLAGTAYRINGTERTLLKGVKIKTGYTDGIGAYIYTNSNSGFFTDGDYFDDDWDDSSTCNSSSSIYALLEIDGEIVCSEYVTIVFDGKSIKGDTGRMYYIAGEFPQNAPYSRTDDLCPVVYYGGEWWYLKTNTTAYSTDTPSDSSDKWGKVEKFGVVLTDAIFVKQFAQFGAAIITQDWLISCHGTIGGVAYGGSVEEPENYNGRAAYTYFDPAYPQGYDTFGLGVITDTIDKGKSTEWTRITNNFRLVAGTYKFRITCHVNSSDTMYLKLFYGDNSSDSYEFGSTQSDDTVVLEYTKTISSSRNDWNLRAGMYEDGEEGYIESIEIEPNDARFVPNYAVDLKTGKSYQSDAYIKGTITTIGEKSKMVIHDGIVEFFGAFSFPNIVLGVDEDGCAILNFYDKKGKFKYGLGPNEIIHTESQAESMTLQYYDVDAGSTEASDLDNSTIVMLYRYMAKNQIPATGKSLYRYLAKIATNDGYSPGSYCASIADAKKYNKKVFKYGFSASAKLNDSDLYNGGIVVTSGRTNYGIIKYLSSIRSSLEDMDYAGFNLMQDSDFNRSAYGVGMFRYMTKSTYDSVEAFYWERSNNGAIGYSNGYQGVGYVNVCTDPNDDDTLVDPIYYFNLQELNQNGNLLGTKTFYINKSKLNTVLSNAGYSL